MRIAHLSDIQIRNFSRHEEYRESFENLYASLRESNIDRIVLVGDIAHTKTKISPEFVLMCSDLLSSLAAIAPVHMVPGNHDGNLNNLSRMDALTPIVRALNSPRIFYYKNSGVFPVTDDVELVHFSCFDSDWPVSLRAKSKVRIGLFHGFVRNATLQNDMKVREGKSVSEFLKQVDYLMLGDIHKMQIMDYRYKAAYCGSYPQQSYGEGLSKGYLIWDIESKTKHSVDFVKLPNVCPFQTVKLGDDLRLPKKLDLQSNSRIRVLSRQLSVFEKNMLRDQIQELYTPFRLDFLDDLNPHRQEVKLGINKATIENLDNVAVQEKLLQKFLKSYKLSEETFERVIDCNKRFNSQIKREEGVLRNIQYRITKLKWSNAFSFAEDNEIDFTNYRGILGVFGKNGSGKSSSVVDVPLYCMFNKISKKVAKNDLIINENKDFCSAEMDFLIGEKKYVISRATSTYVKSGKRKGKQVTQGRTEVDFKVTDAEGEETDLNGEERLVTDAEIRKIFGTAEDYIATSVAPQWKLLNIVDAGGTERQKIIGRYFDIDVFYQKHKLAKDELRDLKSKLSVWEARQKSVSVEDERSLEEVQEKIAQNKAKQKSLQRSADRALKAQFPLQVQQDTWTEIAHLKRTAEALGFRCQCKHTKGCSFDKKIDALNAEAEEKKKDLISQEDLKSKIEGYGDKVTDLRRQLSKVSKEAIELAKSLGALQTHDKAVKLATDEYERLKADYEATDYFMRAMSKDGIVRQIISENLGIINSEISKILSHRVGFTVELQSNEDGKAIDIFFKHEKSRKRYIELCSGMEKTLAEVAIRAALVSITTLPKSNIFVLDESIGALDPEYVSGFTMILEYLKTLFETVILITHKDSLKDFVDHVIEIDRDESGYSQIT